MGPGDSAALMGPSGSGKTSLLHCIAGLLPINAGELRVCGTDLVRASERERARLRLQHVGMVFQFGELLPELRVVENIALPLRLRGVERPDRIGELLDELSLTDRQDAFPGELSGGEVQRTAIARAVAGSPSILLADEPTGALDGDLSETVCDLLVRSAKAVDAALIVATHDPAVASTLGETYYLRNGALHS